MGKLGYILTVGYYLVPKRNELSGHEENWRKLTGILLREKANLKGAHTV